jgi:hypothetical protein
MSHEKHSKERLQEEKETTEMAVLGGHFRSLTGIFEISSPPFSFILRRMRYNVLCALAHTVMQVYN